MIWSLSTRTCKQMKVRNKHWYRFCHSKPTMVFIPMPIQKFEYKSFDEFLCKANKEAIDDFYKKINESTGKILKDGDPIYIKTCDLDGRKNTHVQVSNRPLEMSHRIDVY